MTYLNIIKIVPKQCLCGALMARNNNFYNREQLPEEIRVKNDTFDNEIPFNDGLGYNQAPESESTRVTLKIRLKI